MPFLKDRRPFISLLFRLAIEMIFSRPCFLMASPTVIGVSGDTRLRGRQALPPLLRPQSTFLPLLAYGSTSTHSSRVQRDVPAFKSLFFELYLPPRFLYSAAMARLAKADGHVLNLFFTLCFDFSQSPGSRTPGGGIGPFFFK